jgi:hypothetical protein
MWAYHHISPLVLVCESADQRYIRVGLCPHSGKNPRDQLSASFQNLKRKHKIKIHPPTYTNTQYFDLTLLLGTYQYLEPNSQRLYEEHLQTWRQWGLNERPYQYSQNKGRQGQDLLKENQDVFIIQ